MAHGLQARTREGIAVEKQERELQEGMTLGQKVNMYNLRPSGYDELSQFRHTGFFTSMNKPFNDKNYISKGTVGLLIKHIHDHRPDTRSLWAKKYFEDYPYASFMALGTRISEELSISPQKALDTLFIRTIVQSWEGYEGEVATFDFIKNRIDLGLTHNYNGIRHATALEDATAAIDIVLTMDGVPVFGLQVKPKSYFVSSHYLGTKIKNIDKNLLWMQPTEDKPATKVFYINYSDIYRDTLRFVSLNELRNIYGLAA